MSNEQDNSLKKAMFFEKLENKKVRCNLCPYNCIIENRKRGFCNVRENKEGELFSLVYSFPCSIAIDPIEKKPLYHFYPGSKALSFGTVGCNLRCLNCQNFEISTADPKDYDFPEKKPQEIIDAALSHNCKIIAYTYTEPTIFYEYVLECSKLAAKNGIKNILVTNGYINQEPAKKLCRYIDAANIDLKGFSEEFYKKNCSGKLKPVLETIKLFHAMDFWIEITNLIIPGLNNDLEKIKEMCEWIKENIGAGVPLHFTAFYPCYKLGNHKPTSPETIKKARDIALKVGLKYVYTGNILDKKGSNSICPNCKKEVMIRSGFGLEEIHIKNGRCAFCNEKISGVWE